MKAGTYLAKAVGVSLGTSSQKGTEQITVKFQITEGEEKGKPIEWTGYFSDRALPWTLAALEICGWTGFNPAEFIDGGLHGLDKNTVSLKAEEEEYQGVTRIRVRWINDPNDPSHGKENPMSKDQAAAFGDRMESLIRAAREKQKQGSGVPFDEPATGAKVRKF